MMCDDPRYDFDDLNGTESSHQLNHTFDLRVINSKFALHQLRVNC